MRKIIGFCLASMFMGSLLHGQTTNDFSQFSQRQDSLFVKAYERKDVGRYAELLNEFLLKYNGLDSAQRKTFSSRLASAYYNYACTFSLLKNNDQALSYLQRAIGAGYADYNHLQKDTDLDNIRKEPRYRSLVEPLRAIGDYLFILRGSGGYDSAQVRALPKFTYQTPADSNLIQLRKTFALDSIAGSGNEISRILSLMQWVHDLVRHDGNHGNPDGRNAANMIAVCRREGRGLNCRGLSIVLNECYLALGFKSRFVSCMPKDSLGTDPDSHVINAVWSQSLKKWVWVDATNNAYVMNEKGELLSIEEVRNRLIKNEPLIVNPDANWNRRSSVVKEDYLNRYMAKNLYKLICPVESRYDLETRQSGKTIDYVELLPLGHSVQAPIRSETSEQSSSTTLVRYKTNNAKAFWARPD